MKICKVPECKAEARTRGWCNRHYQRVWKSGDPGPAESLREHRGCAVVGCLGKYYGNGLCNKHYQRARLYGSEAVHRNQVCAICGRTESTGRGFHVDHDHACCPSTPTCGKCTRGILCHGCNTSLGHMHDDPALLRKAAEYIEQSR